MVDGEGSDQAAQPSGQRSAWTVVRPVGDVDLATRRAFEDALWTAVGERKHVLVDLRQVEFIDAQSVAVMLRVAQQLAAYGRRVAVCREPRSPVAWALDVLDAERELPVVVLPDEEGQVPGVVLPGDDG